MDHDGLPIAFELTGGEDDFVTSQVGEAEVKGVEAEAKWQFEKELKLIGSLAWMDSEITSGTDLTEGNRLPYVPRMQAAIWADYSIDTAALSGLSVNDGVCYFG
jgi:iron complex outermembrane recepter protein